MKTTLRLKASTYVAPRTLRKREAVMNDGYTFSGKVVNTRDEDGSQIKTLQAALAKAEQQAQFSKTVAAGKEKDALEFARNNGELKAENQKLQQELASLKNQLQSAHRNPVSVPVQQALPAHSSRSKQEQPVVQPIVARPVAQPSANTGTSPSIARMEQVVLEVIAEKTGYDVEMVENDASLEDDLGIDSIKRIELLAAIQDILGVEGDREALARTQTVGDVIDCLRAQAQVSSANSTEVVSGDTVTSAANPTRVDDSSTCAELRQHINDAFAAADNVDLTVPVLQQVARPTKLFFSDQTTSCSRPILVLDDGTGLTTEIARTLCRNGHRVVVVGVSGVAHSPKCESAMYHRLDSLDESGVKAFLDQFADAKGFIGLENESLYALHGYTKALGLLVLFAKHISPALRNSESSNIRNFFVCVTRLDGRLGVQSEFTSVGEHSRGVVDTVQFVQRGAVLGLCKSLDLEWSNVFCRGVDVHPNITVDVASNIVLDELFCSNTAIREVGYLNAATRLTTRAVDLREAERRGAQQPWLQQTKSQFSRDDVVLVTGGGRGITPLCIRELAKRIRGGTFLLLGRSAYSRNDKDLSWADSVPNDAKLLQKAALARMKAAHAAGAGPKPTPKTLSRVVSKVLAQREITQSIDAISAAGGTAIYVRCDCGDSSSVEAALTTIETQHNLRVTGIFHAAGVLRDKLIEKKKLENFELVYSTKVTGLLNLLSATEARGWNLRHLVVFSSLAGFHGNAGQTDYSMANEAIAKATHALAQRDHHLATYAFCFGPWDGGMVNAQLKAHFLSQGVQIIPREGGARQVAALLDPATAVSRNTPHHRQYLVGNWGFPASPVDKSVLKSTLSLRTRISLAENPFLHSHQIKDIPVLPMTCAMGHIGASVNQLFPGWHFGEIANFRFFQGLSFPNADSAIDTKVELKVAQPTTDRVEAQCTMLILGSKDTYRPAYKATVVLQKKAVTTLSIQVDPHVHRFHTGEQGLLTHPPLVRDLYDGQTLFHGEHFQGIEGVVRYDATVLVASCKQLSIPHGVQGQFRVFKGCLDPFAADMALQSMLVWARLHDNKAALPTSGGSFKFFKSIPVGAQYFVRLDITKNDATRVVATCTAHDHRGNVFFIGSDLVVTLSDTMSYSSSKKSATPKRPIPRSPRSFENGPTRAKTSTARPAANARYSDGGGVVDGVDHRIAVVGMAVEYGGAKNKDQLWNAVQRKNIASESIPTERLRTFDRSCHLSSTATRYSDTFVNDTYSSVDSDSEHDLLLKLAMQALDDAGLSEPLSSSGNDTDSLRNRTGIVSGCLSFPRDRTQGDLMKVYKAHFDRLVSASKPGSGSRTFDRMYCGTDSTMKSDASYNPQGHENMNPLDESRVDPASYVAQALGLSNENTSSPRYCLDAACASALYCLRLAQDHLLAGDADVMLCGGSCLPEPFFILTGFSTFQALPIKKQGKESRPFQNGSVGLCPGEGGAIMVLKRYSDAVRDGDHIYGTLLGVGLSNSGTGMPLKPVVAAEEDCIRSTYEEFSVDPKTVQYLECHATGTPQGDAAEIQAVRRVFENHPAGGPLVGSSKGNFGHSLVAAGFAGMCKLLQSMQRAIIPPTPIDSDKGAIDKLVVTETTEWPSTTVGAKVYPRRGGLSAFGFGGTNAHAVFEEFVPSLAGGEVSAPQATVSRHNAQSPATSTGTGTVDVARAERVVLEVIAEKTGYDVEMVETDASLEDDLGIDSIKRIELLAAIQDILGIEGDREALARTQTVGDVINCLRQQAGTVQSVKPLVTSVSVESKLDNADTPCKLAIVGMAAHFGTAASLQEFEEMVYSGTDAACDLPAKRWRFLGKDDEFKSTILGENAASNTVRGCFIESVPVNHRYLGLSRLPQDQLLPQQLVALRVIDEALKDCGAGISVLQKGKRNRVAVLVGLGTDMELYRHRARCAMREMLQAKPENGLTPEQEKILQYVSDVGTSVSYTSNIGNIIATRISALWNFVGPSFTITQGANSVHRCLDIAKGMLARGEVDAAVVAGVDMAGSAEQLYLKARHGSNNGLSPADHPSASFESAARGFFAGEGCGALVLTRFSDVQHLTPQGSSLAAPSTTDSCRIYAAIDAVAETGSVRTAAYSALRQANVDATDVAYVEVSADGPENDDIELRGLTEAFSTPGQPHAALGTVTSSVGDVGHASGAAALIKTALCLYNRYLPVLPRWEAPKPQLRNGKHAPFDENSPFYVCPESRAWVTNPEQRRIASVSGIGTTAPGSCFNIILSDVDGHAETENVLSASAATHKVLIVGAASNDELLQLVESLAQTASTSDVSAKQVFISLLRKTIDEQTHRTAPSILSLVATPESVTSELKLAARGLQMSKGSQWSRQWSSPAGSCFAPTPVSGADRVAFMYGDGASPYAGLGQDLHRIAPAIHTFINEAAPVMWTQSDEAWNVRKADAESAAAARQQFQARQVDMFRSGVYHSVVHTYVARDVLGLEPKAAFGLSMGEVAMLFAFSPRNTRCSQEMITALNSSPVWTRDLAVHFEALRVAWNIAPNAPLDSFWQGFVVRATPDRVREVLQNSIDNRGPGRFVRLLIVNDANTCLIAGKPDCCQAIVSELGVSSFRVDQGMVGHCIEVEPHRSEIAAIHKSIHLPNGEETRDVKLFCSVTGAEPLNESIVKAKGGIGNIVAEIYSRVADFPALFRNVRDSRDSPRVFVELGAAEARCRAVEDIQRFDTKAGLTPPGCVAVSIDARSSDSAWLSLVRMVAKLAAHRVPGVTVNNGLYHSDIVRLHEHQLLPRPKSSRLADIEINGQFDDTTPIVSLLQSSVPATPSASSSTSTALTPANLKGSKLEAEIAYQRQRARAYKGPLIWDYDDLLQYAEGDIAPVFNKVRTGWSAGPNPSKPWSLIDGYSRRVRLPQREYLLCSRVTKLNATTGDFSPCTITTEYDVPLNGELSEGGDVPWAVLVESGQCDLMLISYLGVDFQWKGDRVYRLLDTTLTFYGVASEGDTLVYDISINGFAKEEGKVTMFFFSYNCYVDGRLLIEMRNGVAGFFTDEELAAGKGIVYTDRDLEDKARKIKRKDVSPFLLDSANQVNKTTFSEHDMQFLSVNGANDGWGSVLPSASTVFYKLCARKMLMIDRVTRIDARGGSYGLGLIVGEKDLERDHWYFPCHFKGDQVMAGSLVSDGCSQMLKLYMVWLGLHKTVSKADLSPSKDIDWQFRPVNGVGNKVRCRGQISPHRGKLVYVMEISELGFDPQTGFPFAKANVDILDINYEKGQQFNNVDDRHLFGRGDRTKKIVVDFQNIALQIQAKATVPRPSASPQGALRQGSAGLVSADAAAWRSETPPSQYMKWGSELGTLDGRRRAQQKLAPGKLSWHPLAGKHGNPMPGFTPTAYPPRAITFLPFPNNPNDNNHTPGVLPLSWVNLCEFMCNKVSLCLGDEFARFDDSTTSRSPAFDLQVVTRVLEVTGMEKGSFCHGLVDVNPAKGTMVAEFDCPADAWFFKANSHDSLMPYSILMEIGLQTSGILTSWVKAPLCMDRDNILFRNLDATATLTRDVDLRGRTIVNTSTCTGYSKMGDMAVHRFHCELALKGEESDPFYIVDTSFGWFIPEVFEKQVGLDGGKPRDPWHLVDGLVQHPKKNPGGNKNASAEVFDLRAAHGSVSKGEAQIFGVNTDVAVPLRRRSSQVRFLDSVTMIRDGGRYELGYVFGEKHVDQHDWFFSCHFWCDPVMPGSLGIESMMQCMELYAVRNGLHEAFVQQGDTPRFTAFPGETVWKYRGQLTPKNNTMGAEVHITSISEVRDELSQALAAVEITATGYLYVDRLRCYEAKKLRMRIVADSQSPQLTSSNVAAPQPTLTTGTAAVAATQSQVGQVASRAGPSVEEMERVVLEVIAEKTGYDVDMVEQDASLEDDLGIDSIKRIELLSAIQDILGVEGDREALARTQTVGDVIECLRAQAGSGAPAASSAPVTVVSSGVAPTGAGPSVEEMERVVLEVIAEKTGYDVDMVEQDASLEDDLGIDSIKRIELLSAIQDILGVEGDREALARTQTVGDVIECLRAQAGSGAPAASSAPVAVVSSGAAPTGAGPSVEEMERVVLEVIAEKTGYDVDMVEQDASLEDDLGIDSIKRIELLAAIQDILGVEGDREALARTQTVGDVIECLRAQAGAGTATTSEHVVATAGAGPVEYYGTGNGYCAFPSVNVADVHNVRSALLNFDSAFVPTFDKHAWSEESGTRNVNYVPALGSSDLGHPAFLKEYGVTHALYTGAMAKGIASADLVIAAGRAGLLGSLGAGGLSLDLVETALDKIQSALDPEGMSFTVATCILLMVCNLCWPGVFIGLPYAVNLIHSPFDASLERGNVELFLRRGVRVVEASAFMNLTEHVVRYRVAGLERDSNGTIVARNKVIFKLSRTELAEMALRPPPAKMVASLLAQGLITAEQAEMAEHVTMADDVAVESDSGGHTDNRPLHVIFPLIKNLARKIAREYGFPAPVRVGAGGGIGCPEVRVFVRCVRHPWWQWAHLCLRCLFRLCVQHSTWELTLS